MPLSPCCPYHPAGVSGRLGQPATCHAAFAPKQGDRPPDLSLFGGHLWVHFRYGTETRSPALGGLCQQPAVICIFGPFERTGACEKDTNGPHAHEVGGSDAVDLQLQVVLPPGGILL